MKADEFQRVGERIFFWEAYDPAVKTNLSCCAVRTSEGLVFIDPIPLAREAMEELLAFGPPAAVVLTSANHLRAGAEFRDRLRVPLLAHADALAELGLAEEKPLREGDLVAGELRVYEIEGAAAGEIALHSESTGLHLGDALINVEPYGFALLPEKYCANQKTMLRSLRRLAGLEFASITFAHGIPIVARAREQFGSLVESTNPGPAAGS
jgi:hypothetical protein